MTDMSPRRSFLFLQGPFGPFFWRLARALAACGCETRRIITCGGEWVFWPAWESAIPWRGRIHEWPQWIAARLAEFHVTDIVLMGDWRPLHVEAILLARQRGARVWVFEEGYLRPSYVTLELGGVNGWSPLPRDPDTVRERAGRYDRAEPYAPSHAPNPQRGRVFQIMRFYAGTLALWPFFRHYRTHRPESAVRELSGILPRYLTRGRRTRDSLNALRGFLPRKIPFYFFPLQLDSDAQIRRHSPFSGVLASIRQVVTSFALRAPRDAWLLIKNHPFDNGLIKYRRYMRSLCRTLGCSKRVIFVEAGNTNRIIRECRAVVLCNSTVGLSALQMGKPVYCLGSAIYAMPGLAMTPREISLDDFWAAPSAPDMDLVASFVRLLKHEALLPGNFYGEDGIRDAVRACVRRMGVKEPA